MKERKWWNSVPRVPGTWWRSPSTSHQESDQQAELPEETPGIEEVAITENHKEPEALPELPEGVTPDDILGNLSTTAKSDSGLDAAGSTSIPPRAMSTPPRRRKEFVVEGIPNISFSFFNEQAVATAASEACLSPSREAAPAMDATVTSGTTTTIVVGEDAGDYEVLRRVIPVNSTPVQHCSSLVAVLGQEPSKKSPNISRINIVSINTAAPSENPYASPRNSLPDAEQHDTGPDCAGVSVQNSSPFPDTCPQDHGKPSAETPTLILHNSKSSSEPEAVLSSLDCTPTFSDSNPVPAQDASPTSLDCTPLSSNSNPLPAEDSSPSSPDCTTPTFEVSPEDSTLAMRSSEPQDIPLSSITISLPLELTDQSVYSGADWETITDFGSDYCDLHRRGQRLHTAPNSDYEDVETRHDYCDVPRRRATLMRDRRRGLGTVRTRIRRAWRAVRGWWSEERVRLGDAIQRHAHAQAVRHDKEEDKKAQEDQEARVVVLRRKSGALREGSRPSSRAGLRRSRHFPEVGTA